MERGSSAVECRTRNRERSRVRILPLLPFQSLGMLFYPRCPSSLSCLNEYLAIDSGGNVSDFIVAHSCCMARMLPREVKLVSE